MNGVCAYHSLMWLQSEDAASGEQAPATSQPPIPTLRSLFDDEGSAPNPIPSLVAFEPVAINTSPVALQAPVEQPLVESIATVDVPVEPADPAPECSVATIPSLPDDPIPAESIPTSDVSSSVPSAAASLPDPVSVDLTSSCAIQPATVEPVSSSGTIEPLSVDAVLPSSSPVDALPADPMPSPPALADMVVLSPSLDTDAPGDDAWVSGEEEEEEEEGGEEGGEEEEKTEGVPVEGTAVPIDLNSSGSTPTPKKGKRKGRRTPQVREWK